MKKLTIFGIIILMLSTFISGCGASIPDLSEEQTELITEYAAGLMIKYNNVSSRNLLNEEQMEVEEEKEAEKREKERKKEEAAKAYLEAQEKANVDSEKEGDDSNKAGVKNSTPEISDMAYFYGLEGFAVTYSGYQLCQSYPDESREDYFLAMDATAGKQLCILQFQVTNTTAEDKEFDMFAKKPIFYLSIDGGEKIPVQSTLLLDDLSSYKGVIATGNSEQMVLAFEIDESLEYFSSLDLTARYQDQKGMQKLQ